MKKENKEYSKLLLDPRWRAKRLEILERDKYTCRLCGKKREDGVILHVHHILYHKGLMPWEYWNKELITLCAECHNNFHKKQKAQIERKKRKKIEKRQREKENKEKEITSRIVRDMRELQKGNNEFLFFDGKHDKYMYYGTYVGLSTMLALMMGTSDGFDIILKMTMHLYENHQDELKKCSFNDIIEKYKDELERLYLKFCQ